MKTIKYYALTICGIAWAFPEISRLSWRITLWNCGRSVGGDDLSVLMNSPLFRPDSEAILRKILRVNPEYRVARD